MNEFEYQTTEVKHEYVNETLQNFAREGWELVSTSSRQVQYEYESGMFTSTVVTNTLITMFFKRKIKQNFEHPVK